MATANSSLYTAQLAALSDISQRPDATRNAGGELKFQLAGTIVMTGTEATDGISYLGYLPKGAMVDPYQSRISFSGDPSSSTITVDIGTATDVDCFADGIDVSAGGTNLFTAPAVPLAGSTITRIGDTAIGASDTLVQLKWAGVAGTLTARTISFWIEYAMPRG